MKYGMTLENIIPDHYRRKKANFVMDFSWLILMTPFLIRRQFHLSVFGRK
jgi:hypothetical protein